MSAPEKLWLRRRLGSSALTRMQGLRKEDRLHSSQTPDRTRIELTGHATFADRRGAMPDTLDLVGWKIVRAGVPLPAAATLGEARASVGR